MELFYTLPIRGTEKSFCLFLSTVIVHSYIDSDLLYFMSIHNSWEIRILHTHYTMYDWLVAFSVVIWLIYKV